MTEQSAGSTYKLSKEYFAVAAVAAVSFLVRYLYYSTYFSSVPYALLPLNDARMYWETGMDIFRHGWLFPSDSAYYQAPLYSFFIAALHHFGFHTLKELIYIQLWLGVINAVLCYVTARHYLSPRYACLAALLFSLNPFVFTFETKSLATTLGLTLWMSFINLFLRWIQKSSLLWILLSALFLVLSIICRPNLIFTFPFILLLFMTRTKEDMGETNISISFIPYCVHKHAIPFVCTILLLLCTVSVRNYYVSGEYVFLTVNSGITLYMGNNSMARGGLAPVEGLSDDIEEQVNGSVELASRLSGENISAAQSSTFWIKKTVSWVVSHPLEWVVLEIKKIFWAFYYTPPAVNYSLHFESEWIPSLKLFYLFSIVILCGGILSIPFVSIMDGKKNQLLLCMILGYILLSTVYYSSGRFLTAVVPFLSILTVLGLQRLQQQFRIIKTYKAYAILSVWMVLFVVLNPFYSSLAAQEKATGWYNMGVLSEAWKFQKAGKIPTVHAEECYQNALRHFPHHPSASLNLGVIYAKQNRLDESNQLFETLLEWQPQNAIALKNLIINYQRQGRESESLSLQEKYAVQSRIQ